MDKYLKTPDYLDIVFAGRNKNYGAYALRRDYNSTMLKTFGVLAASVISILAFAHFKSKSKETPPAIFGHTNERVVDVIAIPKVKEIVPKSEGSKNRTAKTMQYTDPKIVKDNAKEKVQTKMPDHTSLAGPVNNEGLKDGIAIALDETLQTGLAKDLVSKEGTEKPPVDIITEVEKDVVQIQVEQMPMFPGGSEALQKYLQSRLVYPPAARDNDITGKVYVSFIVGKTGEIEDVKVVKGLGGGCSEEALRVVRNMPKWKPGFLNGHAVKVRMSLPIYFRLN